MHEGFVNFNAGTLGASMVEGRISAGVIVGADSDIGGGASIMGTLSGGGKQVVSIGSGCLLGANSGVGISPIEMTYLPPPERVPMIEAPPPTSLSAPTTTPALIRPSTMDGPRVPAL